MFGWWQLASKSTTPFDTCPPEHAARLVELNLAKRCLKGFAIQLFQPPERRQKLFMRIDINDASCKMGPRICEGAAAGIPYFKSLVAGWAR